MVQQNPFLNLLRRWNFIERARLERELWDAYEAGDDMDAMLERTQSNVQAKQGGDLEAFRLEVWQTTLLRIRKIEALMKQQPKD
jgi:hypothetical protein